jgi:hypothetical protein
MIKTNQHTEADASMSMTFNHFSIDVNFNMRKDSFFASLDSSIRPSHVKEGFGESEIIKEGYLKGLFVGDQLSLDDFRFMPNDSILYYLDGFSESAEEWGEDRQVFKGLLKKLSVNLHNNVEGTYLINKEWFNEDSLKVRPHEHSIYDFYLILVWQYGPTLNICEWSAD